MKLPQVVSQAEEATRARDALAAERRQLVLYHFMFPAGGDPCDGCSMFTDTVGHLAHLHARDTSFALVSPASVAEIEPFRERMGWSIPWFSTAGNDFNADCGITTGFGLSVFLRDGDSVFRSYFTTRRSVDAFGNHWTGIPRPPRMSGGASTTPTTPRKEHPCPGN